MSLLSWLKKAEIKSQTLEELHVETEVKVHPLDRLASDGIDDQQQLPSLPSQGTESVEAEVRDLESDYEAQRRQNILLNQQMLAQLGLLNGSPLQDRPTSKPSAAKRKHKQTKRLSSPIPLRRSTRRLKLQVPLTHS